MQGEFSNLQDWGIEVALQSIRRKIDNNYSLYLSYEVIFLEAVTIWYVPQNITCVHFTT